MKNEQTKVSKFAGKIYSKPTVSSQKVLERAALACSGTFTNNSYTNLKNNSTSCGFNAS